MALNLTANNTESQLSLVIESSLLMYGEDSAEFMVG